MLNAQSTTRSSLPIFIEANMKILDSDGSLTSFLISQTRKKIKIVTAFASGTEHIISKLIQQENDIDLLVGTINAFTAPNFIDYCAKEASGRLSAFVDFRYQDSIHWKLYLISPNIVVIGSSNLTEIGLSLKRDTCVVIEDSALYGDYGKRVSELLTSQHVLRAKSSKEFDAALARYRVAHARNQAGMARTKRYLTATDWLADETNQSLPLFIWDADHTPEERKNAHALLSAESDCEDTPALREFFTVRIPKNKLPYSPGDVVLCSGKRGGYMSFFVFDRIIYSKGLHYIFSYRKTSYPEPFKLDRSVKSQIKCAIPELFENDVTEIDREKLRGILNLT